MTKNELINVFKNIHGVNLEEMIDIDPIILKELLNHDDDRVARNALFVSTTLDAPFAIDFFNQAIQSERNSLNISAAYYCILLENDSAIQILKKALQNPNPAVIKTAARAAQRARLRELKPALENVLEHISDERLSDIVKNSIELL